MIRLFFMNGGEKPMVGRVEANMVFWGLAGLMTVLVAGFVLRPLLRGQSDVAAETLQPVDYGLQVYRDQLNEVDRDLAKGTLSEGDAERTRLEISHRILEADKDASGLLAPKAGSTRSNRIAALLAALVLGGGAFGTYVFLGASGAPDQPLRARLEAIETLRSSRPSQTEIEAGIEIQLSENATDDYVGLVTQLRKAVAANPNELQGQRLLAQHEARIGDFARARTAQGNVIRLLGEETTGVDYVDWAELMIIAANGLVSPEAEQALAQALQLVPQDGRLRYYSGLNLMQTGRPDIAYSVWANLLNEGPDDAPWIAPIQSQIAIVARAAGMQFEQPAPQQILPGPDAEQIDEASDLSDQDRDALVRSMVGRLSERLANEGGTADEWARLIRALGVLGETEKAEAIWDESKQVFASDPIALESLKQAAQNAGIAN